MNQVKIDNYTKGILTLIAACLTVLTLHQLDIFPKAHASTFNPPGAAINANYGLVPLNEDGSISVTLRSSDEIDVNIVGINTFDKLDVNIEEVGGGFISHGGPIPVEVE